MASWTEKEFYMAKLKYVLTHFLIFSSFASSVTFAMKSDHDYLIAYPYSGYSDNDPPPDNIHIPQTYGGLFQSGLLEKET